MHKLKTKAQEKLNEKLSIIGQLTQGFTKTKHSEKSKTIRALNQLWQKMQQLDKHERFKHTTNFVKVFFSDDFCRHNFCLPYLKS